MLVLVQALLCHSWLAYRAMQTSSSYSRMHTRHVSAGGHICCSCCGVMNDTEHQQLAPLRQQEQVRHHQNCQQADSKEQQMQQPMYHRLQFNCQPAGHLCDYQMHVQQQQQQQCLAQHVQKQLLCSKQADQALTPAVLPPHSLQQPKLLPAQGRHQVAKCAIFIKLVVCCILLRTLPFTAWLKQSRHSWQPAAWMDALPDALLGAHAALLAFLVSCVKVRLCTLTAFSFCAYALTDLKFESARMPTA